MKKKKSCSLEREIFHLSNKLVQQQNVLEG